MNKKKLDWINFFYSTGAVVILVGVIAKFLEWESQEILLLSGLGIEALVFIVSAIQYKIEEKKEYNWENLFPELVDDIDNPKSISVGQKKFEELSSRYFTGLTQYVNQFDTLNTAIVFGSEQYQKLIESMSAQMSDSSKSFSVFNENIIKVNNSFVGLYEIGDEIQQLQINLQKMTSISIISGDKMNTFQEQLEELNNAIFRFNTLSSGIITQFKQIGN